jgi:hypothetical protein
MKTREWLFLIFIVILVQFIIQASAWLYSGNSGASSYVSFAGTIVSIILAVLAIVYSFVQTVTQQNAVNIIGREVDRLSGVSKSISDNEEKIKGTVSSLGEVSKKIDKSISNQETITKKVDGISGAVEKMANEKGRYLREADLDHSRGEEGKGDVSLSDRPFYYGHNGVIFDSVLLYYGELGGFDLDNIFEGFVLPAFKRFVKVSDEDVEFLGDLKGSLNATAQCFRAFGLLEIDESYKIFKLNDQFKESCQDFLGSIEEDKRKEEKSMLIKLVESCHEIVIGPDGK